MAVDRRGFASSLWMDLRCGIPVLDQLDEVECLPQMSSSAKPVSTWETVTVRSHSAFVPRIGLPLQQVVVGVAWMVADLAIASVAPPRAHTGSSAPTDAIGTLTVFGSALCPSSS